MSRRMIWWNGVLAVAILLGIGLMVPGSTLGQEGGNGPRGREVAAGQFRCQEGTGIAFLDLEFFGTSGIISLEYDLFRNVPGLTCESATAQLGDVARNAGCTVATTGQLVCSGLRDDVVEAVAAVSKAFISL